MTDLTELCERYLEWLHDQTEGSTTRSVAGQTFLETEGLEVERGWDIANACADMGMTDRSFTFGNPLSLRLTPAGVAWVQQRRQHRSDPANRRVECRNGLLRWVADHSGDGSLTGDAYAEHPTGNILGDPFTVGEVREAGRYLERLGLVFVRETALTGAVNLSLTEDGRMCLEDCDGDVAEWRRQQNVQRGTTFDMRGGYFAGHVNNAGGNIGAIQQNITHGLDVDAVSGWLRMLEVELPSARLQPDQLTQLQATIAELKAQLDAPKREPDLIRQLMTSLISQLPEAITTAAASHAPTVLRKLLEWGLQLLG